MKKDYLYIVAALLISLFIYVFYRTDKTLVNQFLINTCSLPVYHGLKMKITEQIPLSNLVIYSLPEGLWIFCITLTSKSLYLPMCAHRFKCIYLPLIFAIGLEIMQLFHFTNGQFDFFDIGASIFFWFIAANIVATDDEDQNILNVGSFKRSACVLSYSIVYLAHVIR